MNKNLNSYIVPYRLLIVKGLGVGLLLMTISGQAPCGEQMITTAQAMEDVKYFLDTLEVSHPDLLFRCPQPEYDSAKSEIQQIGGPDKIEKDYLAIKISRFLNHIHDGHTRVTESQRNCSLRLPFHTRMVGKKVFIDRLFIPIREIPVKSEIVAFNGIPILEYLSRAVESSSYEIFETAIRKAAINLPCKAASPDPMTSVPLRIKSPDGKEKTLALKWENNSSTTTDQQGNPPPFEFRSFPDISAGYIKMNEMFDRRQYLWNVQLGFRKNILDPKSIPDLEEFLHKTFSYLNTEKIPYLIIDLRDNPGGNSALGRNIISFLSREKIKDFSGYVKLSRLLKDSSRGKQSDIKPGFDHYPIGVKVTLEDLEKLSGTDQTADPFELQTPPKSIYKGKVIALINRGTYSAAEIFAVLLQDNNLALLAGEPSGNGGNGPIDTIYFTLPNSGIEIQMSPRFRTRPDEKKTRKTLVEPDILIHENPEDYLTDRDTILEEVRTLIALKKV